MIPLGELPLLAWKYRRWIAYGIAGLAVAILAWRVAAWREGYQARNAAVAALEDERKAREDDRKVYDYNLKQSKASAEALSADLSAIRQRYANMQPPAPKTLIRTIEVPIAPQQTTCPDPRISAAFVGLWNEQAAP